MMRYKHGLRHTRIYGIWLQMKNRCYNTKTERFKDYGGRGIIICEEWRNNFKSFYDWSMSNGYKDGLTIDRINNNGNYEPKNCRWVEIKTQNRNARSNHLITYKNETHCISEWAEITGISRYVITNRLKYGWSIERVFSTPIRSHKLYKNTKGVLNNEEITKKKN